MRLPESAELALAALRRRGLATSLAVEQVCHSGRYRLSVRYRGEAGEVRVGLAYSEDREALEQLRERLET